ncbi:high-affinity zinc transporter membrane component [Suttonella indologenes]|uniref:High-affinity zinc transporter membrane component n=1 Tax=Suttonella indologenes TaxID=13276 RepID=A0A380MMX3_9GAMM|nr:high-affinity zinc transporter membrane component [Suttonella indologenes]
MLISFNPQLAKVRKVKVILLDYLFIVLITLATISALKIIGAILVGALLVIPAAAARLIAGSMRQFFFLSVAIAYDIPAPSGGAIILIAGSCFMLLVIVKQLARIK